MAAIALHRDRVVDHQGTGRGGRRASVAARHGFFGGGSVFMVARKPGLWPKARPLVWSRWRRRRRRRRRQRWRATHECEQESGGK